MYGSFNLTFLLLSGEVNPYRPVKEAGLPWRETATASHHQQDQNKFRISARDGGLSVSALHYKGTVL